MIISCSSAQKNKAFPLSLFDFVPLYNHGFGETLPPFEVGTGTLWTDVWFKLTRQFEGGSGFEKPR